MVESLDPADEEKQISEEDTKRADYAEHPEVIGKLYYTLPVDLLKVIVATLRPKSDLASALRMEIEFAKPRGLHNDSVGYWQESNVRYDGFRLQKSRLL